MCADLTVVNVGGCGSESAAPNSALRSAGTVPEEVSGEAV
jgi:hypothetical protein